LNVRTQEVKSQLASNRIFEESTELPPLGKQSTGAATVSGGELAFMVTMGEEFLASNASTLAGARTTLLLSLGSLWDLQKTLRHQSSGVAQCSKTSVR
jgi:hypothetical protein